MIFKPAKIEETIEWDKLQTGDILICRYPFVWNNIKRYLSAAIRFFTRCYYNHSAIAYVDNIVEVYESNEKGFVKEKFEAWLKDKEVIVYRLKPEYKKPGFSALYLRYQLKKYDGVKYDFVGVLFYQLLYQIGIFKSWARKKLKQQGDDKLYCSEIIALLFKKYVPLFKEFYLITTKDIYKQSKYFDQYKLK